MALPAASKTFMLLGQCVPCVKKNTSRFLIKRLELDKHLLMYFRKDEYVYAHDPEQKCKTGDVVLIEQLPQKMTTLITHKVRNVIYPMGDVTDPLTGKKVVGYQYRDDIEEINKVYGKHTQAFDYESAPPRGWQEDKKDFTRRETYQKYNVFEEEDPYSV